MSVSQATKLHWFDQGAAALAQVFPESPPGLGSPMPPIYACPLCLEEIDAVGRKFKMRLFLGAALVAGELTAEHVPPKSFGGRELLLTCKSCNATAGARLDAHARRRENPEDAFSGRARKAVRVRIAAGGHSLAANFRNEGGTMVLRVLPQHKGSRPGAEDGFRKTLLHGADGDRDIRMTFEADRYFERRAHASWLRAGYLALFGVMGYRYVFSPGLEVVRRQIREPDTDHIPTFMCLVPGDYDWSRRVIIRVREPEWLQSWAVRIGRYALFLPLPGDTGLYDRIAAARRGGADGPNLTGQPFDWPRRPSFGLA